MPNQILSPDRVKLFIDPLRLGEVKNYTLFLKADSIVPVGITKSFEIKQGIYPNETNIFDNNQSFTFETSGSYDPNDIQVFPGPLILPDQNSLQYRIRFQNLGNYKADFVVIRDTLPADLEIESFRYLSSSHYEPIIERKGNVLIFKFMNIYLPAAKDDSSGSQGFIRFQIRRKKGLPIGTIIENSASIYFDFNPPVKTNFAMVKIWNEDILANSKGKIIPNPADHLFYLKPEPEEPEIEVFDFMGKRVARLSPIYEKYYSALNLPNGLFLLKYVANGKLQSEKLIVNHKSN